jgi:hypothetical protein
MASDKGDKPKDLVTCRAEGRFSRQREQQPEGPMAGAKFVGLVTRKKDVLHSPSGCPLLSSILSVLQAAELTASQGLSCPLASFWKDQRAKGRQVAGGRCQVWLDTP